ncbi:MAG TPA: GNVR domain-containing protein, partial [Longimicrobiales bacterium]|nr:GNVR domain-containing protein [Longimicrobiales bacterium]
TTVATGPIGSPLRFGGVVAVPGKPRPGAPVSVRLRTIPFGEAAERFRSALTFERSRRDAYVLDVSYDDADPGIAREAVEAAVSTFVALRGELFGRESGTTTDSLRHVVARTAEELARAEAELEAMQRESGLVAPDAQAEAFVQRWVETEGELEAARAELALVEAALVRAGEAAGPGDAWTTLVAQPRFLENSTLGEMLVRLVELEEQRVALATRRSPESREYTVLVDQIAFLDASLRALAESHAESLRAAVAEMEERERRLAARLDGLPAAALDVAGRQRDVRVLTEVLVTTEGRLRQEEVRRALTYANVQVVDPPAVAFDPVWPRKRLGAAVGLLLAAGTGLLAMVVVDRADSRVRSIADLRALAGMRILATPVAGVSGEEVEAVRRAVRGAGAGGVAVCGLDASEHARALASALQEGAGSVEVRFIGAVATPEDVASALRGGTPGVVLVVRSGRTHRRTLGRAVALFREAGATVLGAVLVCRSRRDAEAVWS